jgi:bifunctional non-homologous end joining protein LigD
MARAVARSSRAAALPQWVPPQLTQLVDAAPEGDQWLHEIKFDGYRMHARLDHGAVTLLTRTGLDWTHKYPAIAKAVTALDARQAYLDGELCGIGPDGIPSFSRLQAASDAGSSAGLVLYLFDLLHLDGDDVAARPLIERKARLAALLADTGSPLHYCDHQIGHGRAFHEKACAMSLEGIVSKRADAPYAPGNRGHCTSFSIPIAICRRRIPVAPASRPTRSRLRPPATCRPSDPLHRGAARYFPRNSSMDVRCCGVRNDIVGAGQDCSRGPD